MKNKKHRKTDEAEYPSPYKTYVLVENIRWRAEQAVKKQEVHIELWMEDLIKTAIRTAE